MSEVTVYDDFGRRTQFSGELLVEDTTDSQDRDKPQWLDIDVWRTAGGAFVVRKTTRYRVAHTSASCSKIDGFQTREVSPSDTVACRVCSNGQAAVWGQEPRVDVRVYPTPEGLIEGLKDRAGEYTRLSRSILADMSEIDPRIDNLWNTVKVQ